MTGGRLLTIAEAAAELAVTPRTLRKLIAAGDLQTVEISPRVRRVRRADLDRFVAHRLTRRTPGAARPPAAGVEWPDGVDVPADWMKAR